jgi:hypothetical protein
MANGRTDLGLEDERLGELIWKAWQRAEKLGWVSSCLLTPYHKQRDRQLSGTPALPWRASFHWAAPWTGPWWTTAEGSSLIERAARRSVRSDDMARERRKRLDGGLVLKAVAAEDRRRGRRRPSMHSGRTVGGRLGAGGNLFAAGAASSRQARPSSRARAKAKAVGPKLPFRTHAGPRARGLSLLAHVAASAISTVPRPGERVARKGLYLIVRAQRKGHRVQQGCSRARRRAVLACLLRSAWRRRTDRMMREDYGTGCDLLRGGRFKSRTGALGHCRSRFLEVARYLPVYRRSAHLGHADDGKRRAGQLDGQVSHASKQRRRTGPGGRQASKRRSRG